MIDVFVGRGGGTGALTGDKGVEGSEFGISAVFIARSTSQS